MDHPAFFEARLAVRRALGGLRAEVSKLSVLRETEGKRNENSRIPGRNARARRDGDGPGEAPGRGSTPLVLVALSGGADSLALAAAVAPEARAAGIRAGAVVVDHGLQAGSAEAAERAAAAARGLGLDPVVVRRVRVGAVGGPEAAAREARYDALASAAQDCGADAILTAHTRDDQAEQVLLALARGSGLRSLAGIPVRRDIPHGGPVILRPFLVAQPEITRGTTEAACAELGLEPWRDPHNGDPSYARVRVRERVLPTLESELGPGVAVALARTADLAREDAEALDAIAEAALREARTGGFPGGDATETGMTGAGSAEPGEPELGEPEPGETEPGETGFAATVSAETGFAEPPLGDVTVGHAPGVAVGRPVEQPLVRLPVERLAEQPAAIRNRMIRLLASRGFGSHLSREHVLAIAALITGWRGQGPIHVPGLRVTRTGGILLFEHQIGSPRG